MNKAKDELNFEKSLERLEQIVAQLEEGNLPLKETMNIFEEGVKLVKHCSKTLEDAQSKVEKLVKDASGKLKTEEFES